ncbi:MAG: HlyD family efflux transporter periplasmic adaptor subunit [Prolixibacteraceae bacterium]|nr:HlyD family efflux transporter periplasmic adaptor subunit [Prolixibacteraceae bacterium]
MNKKNRKLVRIIGIIAIIVIVIIVFRISFPQDNSEVYIVKRENFEEVLNYKGEINSAAQVEINLPEILQDSRQLRIFQIRIADIIKEGTDVKKGDYIARLDQSEIMSQMLNVSQKLETKEADLKNAVIDSTVKLTQLRQEISDALLDLEYNKIDLEQSVYESEAYQRKVRMNYQKAEIAINNKKRDYKLEKNKQKVGIQRLEKEVKDQKELLAGYQKAMAACTITSPGDGIIMFAKDPLEGSKYKRDSYIYYFFPLLAVLPNMSEVSSKIYVKEIDISKINIGDSVRVTFDALENVTLGGKISWISALGEDHKDYDMKVFEVHVQVEGTDPELKPAMSSTNDIIISRFENVITVPVNSVFSENDTSFVFIKQGKKTIKRNVITGPDNNEVIVINEGLKEGDQILLKDPDLSKKVARL